MNAFPLQRYLIDLFHYTEEELDNLCLKDDHMFRRFPGDLVHYSGKYLHPSPIVSMITLVSAFPGFRQIKRLPDMLANDGYDFNEEVSYESVGFMMKRKPRFMLEMLYCNAIKPFGCSVLKMFVYNGLSSFDFYRGKNKNAMELLRQVVRSCYSDLMEDNPIYYRRVRTMLNLMVGLGLNGNYESLEDSKQNLQLLPKKSQMEDAFYLLKVVLLEQRKNPLSLQQLARNTTRRTIGGVHFAKRVAELPLPPTMKDFVLAKTKNGRKRAAESPAEPEGVGAKRAKAD